MSEVKIRFGNIEIDLKDRKTSIDEMIEKGRQLLKQVAKNE